MIIPPHKPPPGHLIHKAPPGLRAGVGVGDVGLDIIDGRAVHEVRAGHVEHRPQGLVQLHALQAHAGQAQGVGPEGDPDRVYGMAFAGLEVRFTVAGERLTVLSLDRQSPSSYREANPPSRRLPPSRGGRTVGDQPSRRA